MLVHILISPFCGVACPCFTHYFDMHQFNPMVNSFNFHICHILSHKKEWKISPFECKCSFNEHKELIINIFVLQSLVETECESWASKGINIKYATRIGHKGFKAGSLKKGMEWDYAKQCEYIALFDADYQPEPDFLLQTVPFLIHNQNVALVQARWVFGKNMSSLGHNFIMRKITSLD